MANMEHVQLVRRGRDHVARWKESNPNESLDLNAAYMSYVRAPQVDISGADLRNSDLMGAVMRRANLSGCFLNPSHLYHADLRESNLSGALFNGANMRGADLPGSRPDGSRLRPCDFVRRGSLRCQPDQRQSSAYKLDRSQTDRGQLHGCKFFRRGLGALQHRRCHSEQCRLFPDPDLGL